jgi:hypothetical protein
MKHQSYSIIKKLESWTGIRCKICNEKSLKKVEVRTTIFRGEDDVLWVCDNHLSLLKEKNFSKFYKEFLGAK